ncbi:hypothetical protein [Candidatus Amarolinea dominans]|uniref:hypothetical protein n=1 Tax=Candidatus Amarolinea dominans TaxID=3140696 RepID=UPI003134A9BD|nr:hypothetical protein [Anaerolineae bacterium]
MPADETAAGKGDAAQPGSQRPQAQPVTQPAVGEDAPQPGVQHDRPDDGARRAQPGQRPVQRVKNRSLTVRQKGHAQEEIRIPQRQLALAQGRSGKITIGREVGVHIARRQHAVGEGQPCKERQHEHPQAGQRQGIEPAAM